MDSHDKLNSALETFNQWNEPWNFYDSVRSLPHLDTQERELLQCVWEVATDSTTWLVSEDLAHGCSLANSRLETVFPWLSDIARKQFVKGASYQWL